MTANSTGTTYAKYETRNEHAAMARRNVPHLIRNVQVATPLSRVIIINRTIRVKETDVFFTFFRIYIENGSKFSEEIRKITRRNSIRQNLVNCQVYRTRVVRISVTLPI